MSFGADVASTLERCGIPHAFLGESRFEVDVAVEPEALASLDALVRLGALGRFVQRAGYEVPRSRLYVVSTGEPGRYRWLDVACDSLGVGRYGDGPRAALRFPGAPGRTCYLAAKRAVKGLRGEADALTLRRELAADPDAAARALHATFGAAGAKLADALASGGPLDGPLAAVRAQIASRRRRPRALALRSLFGVRRALGRLRRPTGVSLVLAGPDGVGKSTITDALLELRPTPFRRAVRLGQRRGPLGPPARLLGRAPRDGARPHTRRPSGAAGSAARLAYMWLDALLGWLPRVALPRLRSTLVVQERGYDDTAVDPLRYRLSTPPWLARAFARLLPRADLVVVLDAPAHVVRARKPELGLREVERQLAAWRVRADAIVDASGSVEQTLAGVLDALDRHLARRHRTLAPAAAAVRALGLPAVAGDRHVLVSRRGRPRFVLPGRTSPVRADVYAPARRRDAPGAALLTLTAPPLRLDPTTGLGPAIAAALGLPSVSLAAAAQRDDERGPRAVLAVHANGRVVAYAKVAGDRTPLARERDVLELLASRTHRSFVAPQPFALLELDDLAALLLEPLPARGRPLRRLGVPELEAVAELSALGGLLAPALGSETALVPVHGDFAPWNCGVAADGRLALWDWEEARLGPPLEDVFHWTMERLLLLGRGGAEELLRAVLDPEPAVAALGERLGVAASGRREALRSALAHSSHRDALRLLGETA